MPSEKWLFLRECWRNYANTGSVTPSSRFLARAISEMIRTEGAGSGTSNGKGNGHGASVGRALLEVGPGTGAFTREIVRTLRPADRLDLCEINPTFAEFLEKTIATDPEFAPHRERVRVIRKPAQELAGEGPYDHAVAGLPFNSLGAELTDKIFSTLWSIVRPGGSISYFEYLGMRRVGGRIASSKTSRRLREVTEVVEPWLRAFEERRRIVLLNFPPAVVHHLGRRKEPPPPQQQRLASPIGVAAAPRLNRPAGH